VPSVPYELGGFEFGGVVMAQAFTDRLPEAQKRLDEFLADELKGREVTKVVLEGDPAQKIVEYAHNERVNLILIPTHGYGPFRRFLLGSVTAKVLHDADCPVLTSVHLEEGDVLRTTLPSKVICAVDLGAQSRKVVEWADQFASECGAELVALHATSLSESHSEEMFDPEWRTTVEERVRERMAELLGGAHTRARVLLEDGNPADVVASVAERCKADLIVIGRSEAAGMFGRLRANAYSIIRQSPCPVVSV